MKTFVGYIASEMAMYITVKMSSSSMGKFLFLNSNASLICSICIMSLSLRILLSAKSSLV